MKLLCDEMVAIKFCSALEEADGIEVRRTVDVLGEEAGDARISQYAKDNEYVVLTRDEGFFARDIDHGLIYYSQSENPSPSELVAAVVDIRDSHRHQDYSNIRQSLTNWLG